MSIAVICTGTELLKGSTCNTNLAELGRSLTACGLTCEAEFCVCDHAPELLNALANALKIADTVIITGGLGPTLDDISLETVAKFFGLKLAEWPELHEKVENFWKRLHQGRCPKIQFKQALIPEGGIPLANPHGSASGIEIITTYAGQNRLIYLLPGPPSEFSQVFNHEVLPRLQQTATARSCTRGTMIMNAGESTVAKIAEELLAGQKQLEIAYTAVPGGTRVFLSSTDTEAVETAITGVIAAFPGQALPAGETDLVDFLIKELKEQKYTFSCAESCTGGLIAESLVRRSGVSAVFNGGAVTYANTAKSDLLGISPELLADKGAVSAECAEAMAVNCAAKFRSDCAVSTTGVAGPDGGTPEKPVGTVFIAAVLKGKVQVEELHLRGDRQTIRERAAARAEELLIKMLWENRQC